MVRGANFLICGDTSCSFSPGLLRWHIAPRTYFGPGLTGGATVATIESDVSLSVAREEDGASHVPQQIERCQFEPCPFEPCVFSASF